MEDEIFRRCDDCSITINMSKEEEDKFVCPNCSGFMRRLSPGEKGRFCIHKWVGSGIPGGMVWCAKCDLDHDKEKHEDVSYL
jgi:predicted RNA-binding Zn-ribbon protein involved in translation (DUF1610 family)